MKPCRVTSITDSAQITDGPAYVWGIHQEFTNDASTVALADQATSGGTRVMGARVETNNKATDLFPGVPVYFGTAVYATITGDAPITEIYWHPAD